MRSRCEQRRLLTALLALYLALASGYSLLLPQWEGMDEPAHYILALNLARIGKFSSLEANYEAAQPQPYYRLASIPLRILYLRDPQSVAYERPDPNYRNSTHPIPIFPWSDESFRWVPGLMMLRGLNILLGLGVLCVNYAGLRRLAGSNTNLALAALALTALNPQFLHTAATANNDGLGSLAGAALFWLLSVLHTRGLSKIEAGLAALLALLLPFATKLTVLPLSAALLLALGVDANGRNKGRAAWLILAAVGALAALGFLLPGQASLLYRNISLRLFYVLEDAWSAPYIWRMAQQVAWTYWGKAGWIAVGLPGWAVLLLTSLALVGAGRNLVALLVRDPRIPVKRAALRDLWLAAGLPLVAVARNALSTVYSQGRFLFPAAGAINFLIVSGWQRLLPENGRKHILPALVGLLLLANLLLWFGGLLPVYYQPFDAWFQ